MNSQPLSLAPAQRALLQEFERLHAQWRAASEAADAIECVHGARVQEVQQLLQQRIAADRLHQQAMQLLRDTPI